MKIIFSEAQFEDTVRILSEFYGQSKESVSHTLSLCIKEFGKSDEENLQTSGFYLTKDVDEEAQYIQIFVDPSYNKTNMRFIEIDIVENNLFN